MTLPIAHTPDVAGTCPSTATLSIGAHRVGIVRCQLSIGHAERSGYGDAVDRGADTSHHYALEVSWQDELAPDWPEAYDPDEQVDIEVPAEPPLDDVVDAAIETIERNALHDRCEQARCFRDAGHEGDHRPGVGSVPTYHDGNGGCHVCGAIACGVHIPLNRQR